MNFTPSELKIVALGLEMYKNKLKKMMKEAAALSTAEKEVKQTFLETERLLDKVSRV